MATWGIAQAKAQLSEVVHRAEKSGPQKISRSGREVAVLVSMEEWERIEQERQLSPAPGIGSLAVILRNSPLRGSDLEIPRFKSRKREKLFNMTHD
jgi:prevent-host-death family protein